MEEFMQKMKKAKDLDDILGAFESIPLEVQDLSEFYAETMESRTGDASASPLDIIKEHCLKVRPRNAAHLLLGHKGCGKSTELNKLKERLQIVGYTVETVHCRDIIGIEGGTPWDIMILITDGLLNIADKKGIKLDKGLVDDIKRMLETTEVQVTERSIGVSAGAGAQIGVSLPLRPVINLLAAIKGDAAASYERRDTIHTQVQRRASDWKRLIDQISDEITKGLKNKRPILIFEDLDKMTDLQKALSIFTYQTLAQMNFPIIYTCPIELYYRPEFTPLGGYYRTQKKLPMIKINKLDGTPCTEGQKTILGIILKRADEELFEQEALLLIIEKTGGVLRNVFQMIIDAGGRARRRGATKIEMQDANAALKGLKTDLKSRIEEKDYAPLADIYNDQKKRRQITDREFLLKMLQASVLLEYNGEGWHDLHPLIADFLCEQGYITKLRNARIDG